MASMFKKTKAELALLPDIDMLLMVEKGTRGGICQARHRHAKANNKYMKKYNKDVISSYLTYLVANILYGWAMSQKLPVNGFKSVEKLSRFNKMFIKNYNKNSDIWYFLEVDTDHPKKLFNLHKDLPFLPESKKVNKVENRRHRKIYYSYKGLKTSIKSRISIKKSTQSISI